MEYIYLNQAYINNNFYKVGKTHDYKQRFKQYSNLSKSINLLLFKVQIEDDIEYNLIEYLSEFIKNRVDISKEVFETTNKQLIIEKFIEYFNINNIKFIDIKLQLKANKKENIKELKQKQKEDLIDKLENILEIKEHINKTIIKRKQLEENKDELLNICKVGINLFKIQVNRPIKGIKRVEDIVEVLNSIYNKWNKIKIRRVRNQVRIKGTNKKEDKPPKIWKLDTSNINSNFHITQPKKYKRIICCCGSPISLSSKRHHEKTKKHLKYILENTTNNITNNITNNYCIIINQPKI